MTYLKLSISTFEVTFSRFLNDVLPRIEATGQETSVLYAASGAVSIQGVVYVKKSLWNVEAEISTADYDTLKLILAESEYQRRIGGNPNILITDTTEYYEERGSRTRAIAPSTSAVTRSPYVLYYAQFYGIIQGKPEAQITPKGYNVRFTMVETDPTVA